MYFYRIVISLLTVILLLKMFHLQNIKFTNECCHLAMELSCFGTLSSNKFLFLSIIFPEPFYNIYFSEIPLSLYCFTSTVSHSCPMLFP